MIKNKTQQLVTAGLFLALGILLPFFTSHAFAIPGTVLLPMHIPVLLCGLICGPRYGAAIGLLVPALSSLLTGMPAVFPMLPIMAVQLLVLGALTGLLYQRWSVPLYPSLLLAMVSGWAAYGLVFSALLLVGGELRALSVSAAVVQGIPGVAIQLTLVPALVTALKRYLGRETPSGQPDRGGLPDHSVQTALAHIKEGEASCVVLQQGAVVHMADGRGVSPLLALYSTDPAKMKHALVVDRIIGKAAAMILVLGGVSQVYGMVMSAAGREYLEQHGIRVQYGLCVDVISNRDQNGICPIEKSVLDIADPHTGLEAIKATMQALQAKNLRAGNG